MKKLSLLIACYCIIPACHSQHDVSAATLNSIQRIPSFSIFTAPDSLLFTKEQLQKDRPVILIFFNPDCDHCQKETKELVAHKNELKDLQIVMVSALPYALIKTFYHEYNIASMPNVKMGQDTDFVLGSLYKPARYPSLYIYDTKGSLARVFAGNAGINAILNAVK